MREALKRREQLRQSEELISSSAAVKSFLAGCPARIPVTVYFEGLARHLATELGWHEPCVAQAIRLLYVLDRAGEISITSVWATGALVKINTEVCNAIRYTDLDKQCHQAR